MSPERISLAIIIGSALIYIALERAFPFKEQRFFRDGFWLDFLPYTVVQSYLLGIAIHWLIQWMDGTTGLSRLGLVGDWPLWVQCVFFFVVHDFYIYWFHRLQHHSKYLWRTHEAHHSVQAVDWVAGSRSHPVEILINQTIEFAPIVLLGAHPLVAIFKGTIDAVWGMWIHSNIRVNTGPLQYVINGPEMHRWHHATDIAPPGVNFATKIAIWDWIFGTGYLPKDHGPTAYGLTDTDEYPEAEATGHFLATFKATGLAYLKQTVALVRPFAKEG